MRQTIKLECQQQQQSQSIKSEHEENAWCYKENENLLGFQQKNLY